VLLAVSYGPSFQLVYQSSAVESVPLHYSSFMHKVTPSCLDKPVNLSITYDLRLDVILAATFLLLASHQDVKECKKKCNFMTAYGLLFKFDLLHMLL
jgi:hypothetical protein